MSNPINICSDHISVMSNLRKGCIVLFHLSDVTLASYMICYIELQSSFR